jgi:hypothetical protein
MPPCNGDGYGPCGRPERELTSNVVSVGAANGRILENGNAIDAGFGLAVPPLTSVTSTLIRSTVRNDVKELPSRSTKVVLLGEQLDDPGRVMSEQRLEP